MKKLTALALLGAAILSSASSAAVVGAVPMQGEMLMPMVSYQAAGNRLSVMFEGLEVPRLVPLSESNPGDSFDSARPWFDALDPTRQGRAFSRRIGFAMDASSDPLPEGTAMRIRRLAGTAGLGAYRYSATPPGRFEPVFGTDGATNSVAWNGMMFHPVFTALPGSGDQSMTFEVYLVDSAADTEIAGSGTGPFVLNWENSSDPAALLVSLRTVVFFPLSATNSVIEGTPSLTNPSWTKVTNEIVLLEGQAAAVLEPAGALRFFRLKSPP